MQHFFIFHPRFPKGHSARPRLKGTSSNNVCKHCRHPLPPLPRAGCLHKACSQQSCFSSPLFVFCALKKLSNFFAHLQFLSGFCVCGCVCVWGGFHPFYYHMQLSDAIFLVLMHIFPNSSCHLEITFCHGVSFKQVSWCFQPGHERIRACLCFCSLCVPQTRLYGTSPPRSLCSHHDSECESQENASGLWLLGDTGSEEVLMIHVRLCTYECM